MDKCVYGINMEDEFSESDIRDAILECFYDAHKQEVSVNTMNESQSREYTKKLVEKAFAESGGSYETPTVDDLKGALRFLASYAKNFRDQTVVKKHYDQIMSFIGKLESQS